MIDGISEPCIIIGFRRRVRRLVRLLCGPNNSSSCVGEPPYAHELGLCPESAVPRIEHFQIGVNHLFPGQGESRYGLKGDFRDDAQGAKRDERCAKEVRIFDWGTGEGFAIRERDLEG